MPCSACAARCTVRPSASSRTDAPIAVRMPADRVTGLIGPRRPVRDRDGSAGHRGRGQERGGVGQIGFDDGRPRRRPGRVRPATRSALPSSTRTPTDRRVCTVISMCGRDGTAAPSCTTRTPSVKDGAASSSPETNWDDALASIRTVPPRSAPVPWIVNGRVSPSMSAPSARSASSTVAIGRRRAASSPSKVIGRRSRSRPAPARTASRCRPVRSRWSPGRSSRPGVTSQSSSPSSVDAGAERAQCGGHQVGVPAAQRRDDRARGRWPARPGSAPGWSATSTPGPARSRAPAERRPVRARPRAADGARSSHCLMISHDAACRPLAGLDSRTTLSARGSSQSGRECRCSRRGGSWRRPGGSRPRFAAESRGSRPPGPAAPVRVLAGRHFRQSAETCWSSAGAGKAGGARMSLALKWRAVLQR